MSKIQDKAKRLLQLRTDADEVKLVLDKIKNEKNKIQNELMSVMAEEGFNSVKIDKTSISKAVRKTLAIRDEDALIKELKEKGIEKEFVREQIDKTLWYSFANNLVKDNQTMKGTEIKETEYISIKQN